jgi:hypothetical protein
MCATDEGKEKGERWCKLAIWRNTLPAIKHVWKSVDKLTSGAFVGMWQQRVDNLYSHYSVAITKMDVCSVLGDVEPKVIVLERIGAMCGRSDIAIELGRANATDTDG